MAVGARATVADVLPTLSKPEEYVCGVLDQLHKCKKLHKNASVQIGTSGKGLKPYYRVSYESEGTVHVYGTFFDNHTSFAAEGLPIKGGATWSGTSMNYDEVARLRGSLKKGAR